MTARNNPQRWLRILKNAYDVRGPVTASGSWKDSVMREISKTPKPPQLEEDYSCHALFLRFGFAALLVTLLIHTTYQISSIENTISIECLNQFDPLDYSGACND